MCCWRCAACVSTAKATTNGTKSSRESISHCTVARYWASSASRERESRPPGWPRWDSRGRVPHLRRSIVFDGMDLMAASEEEKRKLRGVRIAYVAQSAAASFNPAHKLIEQFAEIPVEHGKSSKSEAEARREGSLRAPVASRPGQHRLSLSPSGVGRAVAAGHDRHGLVLPPGSHHLRRADHGPGCHDSDRSAW